MKTVARIAHSAHFVDARFWRDYVTTMRPYLLYVSGITGITGLSFAVAVPVGSLVVLSGVFFLAYGFGQALTDCFQLDTDRLSAPYRPLVRGSIQSQDVMVVSLAGLGMSASVIVWFSIEASVTATLAIFGVATYTWFKRRWWGGPWYNAWIVSLLVLMGYQAGAGNGSVEVTLPLIGAMVASFAAYANFVVTGYYKDIEADRATGYHTLPVVFGRRASAWVSDGFAVLAFVGATLAVSGTALISSIVLASPFFTGAMAAALVAQRRLHRVTSDGEAHGAIEPVVHSYILLLAGLTTLNQPTWVPFLLSFYAAFVWTVKRRPMAEQI